MHGRLRFWGRMRRFFDLDRDLARPCTARTRQLRLESLEQRSMLAILYWDPGATGGTNLGGNGTWDATSAVWYDPSAGADVAWTNGDTAAFEGQPGTVSIAAQISAGSIVFNTATGGMGYILSGESLSLSAGASTIEVDSDPAAITSIIAGAGGLTKTGAGMLVLGGANNYAGGTDIEAGTLQAGSSTALGDPGGSLTVNGGQLDLSGYSLS